jgi:hypothetical protein
MLVHVLERQRLSVDSQTEKIFSGLLDAVVKNLVIIEG